MLYREKIAVFSQIHNEEKNLAFLNVKPGGTQCDQWVLKG